MNGYQWTVLLAAWLGWGFDVFDSLLFNYVAPNCVPTLLGLEIGSDAAKQATPYWIGLLTSILLVGWATGGIIFGRVCDRIGRTKTLLITMLMYAVGTALCAIAPNMGFLIAFRVIASLGIGGEWAAGASMVAEVVPEKRRIEAGALLYTAAPLGLFLATYTTYWIQGIAFKGQPEVAWRYVFLCGLIPAGIAFAVRWFVKEPERWKSAATNAPRPTIRELFTKPYVRITLSGLGMAVIALVTWWSCNAFLPALATTLANSSGHGDQVEEWKKIATNSFNVGGLLGTLLTIPIAKHFGRRAMYTVYFILSGAAIMCAFGLDMDPHTRLYMAFPIGLSVFGVFGSFTYYLPELFPTRLRGTGAGFCYNAGRYIAAMGPLLIGTIIAQGPDAIMKTLFWVGAVPFVGLLLIPFIKETRGLQLAD